MDPQMENLVFNFFFIVLHESIFLLRSSPYSYSLLTLTFVFPLFFTILAHCLVIYPPFLHLQLFSTFSEVTIFILNQFSCFILLFITALSLSCVLFIIFYFYSSKPIISFSTAAVITFIFPRLFKAFLFACMVMILYFTTFFMSTMALLMFIPPKQCPQLLVFTLIVILLLFISVYISMSALWHLASILSILESACLFRMTNDDHECLSVVMKVTSDIFVVFLVVSVAIVEAFRGVIVKLPEEEGGGLGIVSGPKILIGGVVIGIMVMANVVGFIIQSIVYHVMKTYYHGEIGNGAA